MFTIYTKKVCIMRKQDQLVRIRENVSKKLLAVQLLLSIRQKKILSKSEILNEVLDYFLENSQDHNE